MNNPLVTVNILSFNRRDELRNTLTKVFEQDYKNIEVIVVDNASSDGTQQMVKVEFPNVILIELKENIGIAGWNKGFEIAKGEYVLVLDDDSYPENKTISRGLHSFIKNSKASIVAMNIQNKEKTESETLDFLEVALSFIGCGALIKSSLFYQIGGYDLNYFLYVNELDYAARCYNAGYEIHYCANAHIIHSKNIQNRKEIFNDNFLVSKKSYYYFFISYSTFILLRLSGFQQFATMVKWFLNRTIIMSYFPVKNEYFLAVLRIIWSFLLIKKKSKPIRKNLQKKYGTDYFPLIDRAFFPNFKKPKIFK